MAEKKDGADQRSSPMAFVVALGLAVLGMMFVTRHVRQSESRLKRQLQRETVWALEAASDIKEGEALDETKVAYREVAKDDQPWSTITFDDPDASSDNRRAYEDVLASLLGRGVNRRARKGDLLVWTDFDYTRPEALSEILRSGRRGVAVEVDRHSMMGGLLQPNDRVDVLASYAAGIDIVGGATGRAGGRTVPKTVVVLEDVTVLAVGGRMARTPQARSSQNRATIVLALTPDQALVLSHVHREASISLLLRSREAETGESYSEPEVRSDDVRGMIDRLKGTGKLK
jgi:Flp pilus assembly protein CpaB